MGHRPRLAGGFKVWLPDHRSEDGHIYRRYLKAGAELLGPSVNGDLRKVELHRYAVAGTVYEQHARTWSYLVEARRTGKGQRPNAVTIARAAKRLGLADMTLQAATARLETLASRYRSPISTPAELLDQMREGS